MEIQDRDQILTSMRGYQVPCILAAAVELDVFEALARSPLTAEQMSGRIQCDLRATATLLDALAGLGLLAKGGTRYTLPRAIQPFVIESSTESVVPMLRHQANCLRRWARLPWTVRTGRAADSEPSIRGEASDQAAFIGAMDVVSRVVADDLIREINPGGFQCILDLGGGPATWTLAWLRSEPKSRAILFDLPHVIPMTRERIAGTEFCERISLVPGDFYADPLPRGADLVWLSAIIHQNSRAENRSLYQKVANTLDHGGWIYIRDIVMGPSRTEPVAGTLFAINMLVATAGGTCYTFDEIQDDLASAGFTGTELVRRDDGMHSIVRARLG
ncbi:MAG: hypothetical protein JW829_11305 [Pirellulales bacterium]|nr:hypothetical protein [Pirellulales bacterium]